MDIGQLVLASNMTAEIIDSWQAAQQSENPEWRNERDIFGQSHMEVGAYLVGLWGLPNPIIETVAYHHTPSDYSCKDFSPLTAVHAALAIVIDNGANKMSELDTAYLEELKLVDRIEDWQKLSLDLADDG
jgi:HD-like signal output (HDOD) protein